MECMSKYLGLSLYEKRNNGTFRTAVVSESWCISKALKQLTHFKPLNLPSLPWINRIPWFSPLGHYVVTNRKLFYYADGALAGPIQLPEDSQNISVSPDDKIITCFAQKKGAAMFYMLHAREAQNSLVVAAYEFQNWRDPDRVDGRVTIFGSVFHDTDPGLILLSYTITYKINETRNVLEHFHYTVALHYEFDHFQSFLVTGTCLP